MRRGRLCGRGSRRRGGLDARYFAVWGLGGRGSLRGGGPGCLVFNSRSAIDFLSAKSCEWREKGGERTHQRVSEPFHPSWW